MARRRHAFGAALIVGLLSASIAGFAWRQVTLECLDHVDARRRLARERLETGLFSLRVREREAIDALGRAIDVDGAIPAAEPREPFAADPGGMVDLPFVIQAGAIIWPREGASRAYAFELGRASDATPNERQALEQARALAGRGLKTEAIEVLDVLRARPLRPTLEAEVELQRASLLATRLTRRGEAIAALEDLLRRLDARRPQTMDLLPWTLAAALRRAALLAESGDGPAARRAVGELAERAIRGDGGFTGYYVEEGLRILDGLERQSSLDGGGARPA